MKKYSLRKINDITETLIDYRGKTPVKSPIGVKLITAKVVKDGFISAGNHEFIAADTYEDRMTRGFPRQWDILITTEAPLGEVAQLRTNEKIALAQRIILLRGNPKIVDQSYYFHSLKSPIVQNQLLARATGTTVLGIKQSELRQVEIPLHPLPVQRKIASVLSAYDDLIQNNTRRIQILEEIVQSLYREWFVYFRFPGNELSKKEEAALDFIPKDWRETTVGETAKVYRGRSYKGTEVVDEGGVPFINLKSIARDGGFRRDGVKRYTGPFREEQTTRAGDIVMAVTDMTQDRRVVARAARIPTLGGEQAVFSMDLVKIAPFEDIAPEYLLGMFRFSDFPDVVKQHANGANVLHLNPDRISTFQFLLPPKELRDRYGEITRPLYEMCEILAMKNDNLRKTRDLLLPKLISGAVEVDDLEIETRGTDLIEAEEQGTSHAISA